MTNYEYSLQTIVCDLLTYLKTINTPSLFLIKDYPKYKKGDYYEIQKIYLCSMWSYL